MNILGISALYHDSAAALVCDGDIIAAAQEERFTRKKADASIPANAIDYCLSFDRTIDQVVYYDNPLLMLDRWLTNAVEVSPNNNGIINKSFDLIMADRLWIHEKLRNVMGKKWPKDRELCVCEHHISHAASAFYPSPYNEAAVLTVDGVGEWATTTIAKGYEEGIEILEQIDYPDSLGLLYSAFTFFCGFRVNFGEYKLMGLAPYGKPKYADLIKRELISIQPDGNYRINQKYFEYMKEDCLINESFGELFGLKRREPETEITKPYMDLAASIQSVTEEAMLSLARRAKELTGSKRLVMAGGTALNCVANGKIREKGLFDSVWVQPAAGDAGGALGCALYYGYNKCGWKRLYNANQDQQKGSYLGPAFSDDEVERYLRLKGCVYHSYDGDTLYRKIAQLLRDEKVIGIHQGRMEFGPRALGNRSIIASAISEKMQRKLNLKIKYRESFRPFAPAVLAEDADQYFELGNNDSPYMLFTAQVKKTIRTEIDPQDSDNIFQIVNRKRSIIPAVTHVDYSARVQTVHKETNSYLYSIISEYKRLTGYSVIVNTSFNVRGEPIVCTPKDAWLCFMRTDMDVLVIGKYLLLKEEQPALTNDTDWRKEYELD